MKKYYLIHFPTLVALQFFGNGMPNTWNNVTGMAELPDQEVADMTWSGNPGYGFLSEEQALARGILKESLAKAYQLGSLFQKPNVVNQRNTLLTEADKLTQADRWDNYTQSQKDEISAYKQALKDIPQTTTDWFNVIWPISPNLK
jgi:Phage tail assembly chaperone protein